MEKLELRKIVNNTENLLSEFVRGENYVLSLSDKLFKTFYPGPEDADYLTYINEAKTLINISKVSVTKEGILHIETLDPTVELCDKVKVAIVRYTNLAHKGRYFIVLNKEVVFIPQLYSDVPELNVQMFVTLKLHEEKKRKSNTLVKRLRAWVNGLRFYDAKLTQASY